MPPAIALSYTPGYNQCVKDLPRGCHQEFKLYTIHWITAHKSNVDVEAIDVYDSVYNSFDNITRSVFQNVTTLK